MSVSQKGIIQLGIIGLIVLTAGLFTVTKLATNPNLTFFNTGAEAYDATKENCHSCVGKEELRWDKNEEKCKKRASKTCGDRIKEENKKKKSEQNNQENKKKKSEQNNQPQSEPEGEEEKVEEGNETTVTTSQEQKTKEEDQNPSNSYQGTNAGNSTYVHCSIVKTNECKNKGQECLPSLLGGTCKPLTLTCAGNAIKDSNNHIKELCSKGCYYVGSTPKCSGNSNTTINTYVCEEKTKYSCALMGLASEIKKTSTSCVTTTSYEFCALSCDDATGRCD